ncbi:hypothetical protein JL721_12153 [Aureococcus anophagefferens]|nr:hypothetical protein JL721_12153 [Aureococcus anophagefferens]
MMRTDKARAVQSSPRLEDPGDDGKSDKGDGGDESDEAETPRADAPPPRSPSKALGARGRTASELVAGLEEEEMLALLGERIELGDAAEHLAGGGAARRHRRRCCRPTAARASLERMEDLLQETAAYAVGDDQKAEKWKRPSLAAAHDAAARGAVARRRRAPGAGAPRDDLRELFDRGNGGTSSPMLLTACLVHGFTRRIRGRMSKRLQELQLQHATASQYSVLATGLPGDTEEQEVLRHFHRRYDLRRPQVAYPIYGLNVRGACLLSAALTSAAVFVGRRTCGGRRGPEKISPSMAWTVRVPDPRPVREEDHRSDRERRRPKRHSGDGSYGAASAPAAEVTYLGKWVADALNQLEVLVEKMKEAQRELSRSVDRKGIDEVTGAFVTFEHEWSAFRCAQDYAHSRYAFLRHSFQPLNLRLHRRAHFAARQKARRREQDRQGPPEPRAAAAPPGRRRRATTYVKNLRRAGTLFLSAVMLAGTSSLVRYKIRVMAEVVRPETSTCREAIAAHLGRYYDNETCAQVDRLYTNRSFQCPGPREDFLGHRDVDYGVAAPRGRACRGGSCVAPRSALAVPGSNATVDRSRFWAAPAPAAYVAPGSRNLTLCDSPCQDRDAQGRDRADCDALACGVAAWRDAARGGEVCSDRDARRTRYSRNDLVECYCDREVRCKEQRLLHFERLMLRYAWTHAARKFLGRSKRLFHVVCREHMATHLGIKWIDRALVLVVVAVNSLFQVLFAAFAKVERHDSISTQLVNTAWKTFFLIFLNTAFLVPVFNMKCEPTWRGDLGLTDFFCEHVFIGEYVGFTKSWYENVGRTVVLSVALNMVVSVLSRFGTVSLLDPPGGLVLARRLRDADAAQRALPAAALFDIEYRYSFALTYVLCALVYCSGLPVLVPLTAAYFWASYVADRYLVMRLYAKPPSYDHKLPKLLLKGLTTAARGAAARCRRGAGGGKVVPARLGAAVAPGDAPPNTAAWRRTRRCMAKAALTTRRASRSRLVRRAEGVSHLTHGKLERLVLSGLDGGLVVHNSLVAVADAGDRRRAAAVDGPRVHAAAARRRCRRAAARRLPRKSPLRRASESLKLTPVDGARSVLFGAKRWTEQHSKQAILEGWRLLDAAAATPGLVELQRVHSARHGLESDVLMRTWEIIVEEKRLASYDIMANPRYRLALEFLESVGTFRPKRELVKEIGVFREQVVQLKDRCNRENLERRLTTKVHEIRLEVVRRQEAVKNVVDALVARVEARDAAAR